MGMYGKVKAPDYDKFREALVKNPDSKLAKAEIRTVQSYKDSTDINKILKRAQQVGGLAHVQKYPEAIYGDFDGSFTLQEAVQRIDRANEIFAELPSEVRGEFNNNALEYVEWASKNENLEKLIPQIAEPGSFFPNPVQRGGTGAGAATAPTDGSTNVDAPPTSTEPASEPAGGADTG